VSLYKEGLIINLEYGLRLGHLACYRNSKETASAEEFEGVPCHLVELSPELQYSLSCWVYNYPL